MAFTTYTVSPAKLMAVVRAKKMSKSDLMRKVGASRESILKWTNEKKSAVGVKPDYFRKILEELKIEAKEIEADGSAKIEELVLLAERIGVSPSEAIDRFKQIQAATPLPGGNAVPLPNKPKRK